MMSGNNRQRNKQDDQRPLEEKIRSLKKRNAELASIARKLEEKAKTLQQENAKAKSRSSSSSTGLDGSGNADQVKRVFSRQRAKDLAEHAKNVLAKDKEVEELRKKCHELADNLSNCEILVPQNASHFEEKEELINIIKQAAKERLQLEQQLAHTSSKGKTLTGSQTSPSGTEKRGQGEGKEEVTTDEYRRELEEANKILHQEINKLQQALDNTIQLEQQLREKGAECGVLRTDLEQSRERSGKLDQRARAATACNDVLTAEVTQLQEKEHGLQKDLQDSSQRASTLENAHQAALFELQEKEIQQQQLHQCQSNDETLHVELVTDLKKQLQDLGEKRKEEENRREDLTKQIDRLQEEARQRQKALEHAQNAKLQLEQELERKMASGESEEPAEHMERTDKKPLQNQNDRPVGESFLAAWAQKGPIQVYIAKYNYEPFKFSPNENPEAELPLTAGDYVLVVGEMDEDGFFDGELIDGRQGLVPSNFIEKVEDEDLMEFHAALMQAGHGDLRGLSSSSGTGSSISMVTVMPIEAEPHSATTTTTNNNHINNHINNYYSKTTPSQFPGDISSRPPVLDESLNDLEDIAEIDDETASINSRSLANGGAENLMSQPMPPYPKGLSVDHQLHSSVSISWRGPDNSPGLDVQAYHIIVDGQLKTSVKSCEKTKAVLDGVEGSTVHRISVRCISNRGQSNDSQCTMVLGKDEYPTPTDLKISNLLPTACQLSWLPGNSNYQHSIVLDGKEVRTVKPGIYKQTLTALVPGSAHEVTLIAKSISGKLNEDKSKKWMQNVSASIGFTTPTAGSPDPPLNVQMESSREDGTVHITWIPVTINNSGLSNGTAVLGYTIMADGKKVKDVLGPTNDHVVIDVDDFPHSVPSHLCVRTVSRSGVQSADSVAVQLSTLFVKRLSEKLDKPAPRDRCRGDKVKSPNYHRSEDTDEEIEAAFREAHGSSSNKGSPKPAPRKSGGSSSDIRPKGSTLTTQASIVPAVEITRDSSSEHGPSLDDEIGQDRSHLTFKPVPSASAQGHGPEPSISSRFHGDDLHNPSAFRQVDQIHKSKDGQNLGPSDSSYSRSKKETAAGASDVVDHHVVLPSLSPHRDEKVGDKDSISSEIKAVDDSSVRLFIALFDYDPETMSPNVDSTDEELPFREGQILKVFGDKDPDGFYKGESHGHRGFVPCNMVSEVQIDDPELVEHLLRETDEASQPTQHTVVSEASSTPGGNYYTPNKGVAAAEVKERVNVRKMVALYDYDPQELSPNVDAEVELSFKTGDIVMVYGDMDEDGFYSGDINGHHGLVPSNFLHPAPTSDDDGLEIESACGVSPTRSRSGESFSASQLGQLSSHGGSNLLDDSQTHASPTMSPVDKSKENSPTGSTRYASTTSLDEEKPKKKIGFFTKSKNILKKLTG